MCTFMHDVTLGTREVGTCDCYLLMKNAKLSLFQEDKQSRMQTRIKKGKRLREREIETIKRERIS